MDTFVLNCNVVFNGTQVNFGCPVIVDNELYSRCINRDNVRLEYFDENDIKSCNAYINSQFYDKTEIWRDILTPFSPYVENEIFNYFQLFFPKFYLAPNGFFSDIEMKEYNPLIFEGNHVPLATVRTSYPPTPEVQLSDLSSSVLQDLGYDIYRTSSTRYTLQVRPIIFSENQFVNGKIDLTTNNVVGCFNIAFSKGRVENKLGINGSFVNITVSEQEVEFWSGITPPLPDNDPYAPGGNTNNGGGGGNFDNNSDPVDFPELPSLSSAQSGFITLYNPTVYQLTELSSYMWSDLFDINSWKKIFADPMDAILGLSIVPVDVPSSGAKTLSVGNISTGISINVASTQYVIVDCGILNVNEFWGAYLDYEPFTKAEIYLPYIGIHPIAVDDIMGKTIHVMYHVDILSGACCAYVKCNESVLYSFVGQCSSAIPITGNNWLSVVNGAISIATSIGTMVATGGASAPLAISSVASASVNQMKPSVEKSGAMSGTGGILGIQTPYLILTRPRQALPKNQNVFMGYPSFITEKLDTLKGYTEIETIHLENIPATEDELSEIESLLKSGVIL